MIVAMDDEITSLRHKIDEVDNRVLQLLEKRTGLALRIATARGHGNQDTQRELAVIERLVIKANTQLLSDEAINAIWRCIFEHSRQAQARSVDTIKS